MFTSLIYAVLILLVALNAGAFFKGYSGLTASKNEDFVKFQFLYLGAYCLIMLADWLQGPYLYRLYEHYGYLREQIAALYICGFVSSMISGPMLGKLADQYGRRKLSLICCGLFSFACLLKMSSSFLLLMFSSAVGGLSTSLLFSVFESWMVAEHNQMGFPSEWLTRTYSIGTVCNSIVAAIAGILAFLAADCCGHYPSRPFLVAILFALAAAGRISFAWKEHVPTIDVISAAPVIRSGGLRMLVRDPKVLLLGGVQALFETAMYAFVFMWTSSLDPNPKAEWHPPLGLIFGSFMLALMAGSLLFRVALTNGWEVSRVLGVALGTSVVCLFVGFITTNQPILFVAFVAFETCCGVYLPAIATLRSSLLPETTRAAAMGWLRVPLNFLVVVFLLLVNVMSHQALFGFCTALCLAATAIHTSLTKRLNTDSSGASPLPSS